MHVKLLEGLSGVEEAIQELVRTRPSTKWEIMRSLAGRFTRLELHLAFIALCRKGLILQLQPAGISPAGTGKHSHSRRPRPPAMASDYEGAAREKCRIPLATV